MSSGIFVNGRKLIYKNCGAVLNTVDPCFLKDGSVKDFPNIASAADAIATSTTVFVAGNPACTKSSQLSTTKGSEAGVAGVSSGTIAGPCDFITASDNVFIEGSGALRDKDLGVANNKNTAPVPILF